MSVRAGSYALAVVAALAACKGSGGGGGAGGRTHDAARARVADGAAPVAAPPLDGVWREVDVASLDGTPTGTSWTHRVFAGDRALLVDAAWVHYEGEDGHDGTLVLDGSVVPPRIEVQTFRVPAAGSKFLSWSGRGTYVLAGDRLVITWADLVETLVRETDAALAARLAAPPVRVPRPHRDEPGLGTARWDENYDWWDVEVDLDGHGPAKLSFRGEAVPPPGFFVAARRTVDRLRRTALAGARAFAADRLLTLYNGPWRDDRERLDKVGFMKNLWIEGITVHEDGTVEIFFYDSDMFRGHAVLVSLDARLVPTDATIAG